VIADPRAFVLEQTRPGRAALVPEIALRLATEAVPLWQATEASMAATGLPPPYWAFAWPGGQALARELLDRPERVRGRRVLDVGAGGGIAAIAAAMAGATRAMAAEIDRFALAALAINAAENGVDVAIFDGDPIGRLDIDADVVLIGDLCYERPLAERVVPWLRRLAGAGVEVLLADPGRAYVPRDGLIELARHTVPTSLDLEDRATREAVIYRVAV
jgi:predicted nicotinamide N-methyase